MQCDHPKRSRMVSFGDELGVMYKYICCRKCHSITEAIKIYPKRRRRGKKFIPPKEGLFSLGDFPDLKTLNL